MSKASEWAAQRDVARDAFNAIDAQRPESSPEVYTSSTGWIGARVTDRGNAELCFAKIRGDGYDFSIAGDQMPRFIAFARWIIDTFGDGEVRPEGTPA